MPDLLWLDRIQPSQRPQVGEKAFILSQLQQQGYPIPPGFAISTTTWQQFLTIPGESKPILTSLAGSSLHVDVNDYRALQQLARNIGQDIDSIPLPSPWLDEFLGAAGQLSSPVMVLRPSLTISQGIDYPLRSFLRSQTCWCEPEYFENALKRVWSELFRAKSLFYWQHEGIELERIQIAVLVQPLRNAIASGKVTTNPKQWRIEASRGLGDAWIRGEVEPESYHINPQTGSIETQQSGSQTRVYQIAQKTGSACCLATHPLSEIEPEKAILDSQALSEIITLTQKIQAEKTENFAWEWAIEGWGDERQLFLWQYYEDFLPLQSSPSTSTLKHLPVVTGIGASSGRAIAPVRVLVSRDDVNPELPEGEILVVKTLEAYWLPLLEKAAGLIIEQGNLTSHGAILARELQIPALVGAIDATQLLETGESVSIDGGEGKVYLAEEAATGNGQQTTHNEQPTKLQEMERSLIGTQLWVNLSQPASFQSASLLPVDGVGLVRSELMMLGLLQSQPLTWWLRHPQALMAELVKSLQKLAEVFAPRPVFYRSTDWRSPECPPLPASPPIARNPALGVRGTHTYRLNPVLFKIELAALKQVRAQWNNIHLILPFVRSLEEFTAARQQVEKAGLLQWPSFQLWMMAEVPSTIFLLSEYVQVGVQGIAIGTNDLIQLLLGTDREHSQLDKFYNESHPAVSAALEMLIRGAREKGIPCSFCGQAATRSPELIDRLIEWGITAISVESEAIESTYTAIARAERRLLLAEKRPK